ncbi:unnamed protein product, partial [Allacma fusca]
RPRALFLFRFQRCHQRGRCQFARC